MFVRKVKGRQLVRYIAWIYIILWAFFIIFSAYLFGMPEFLTRDLFVATSVITVVNLLLFSIVYASSYKIKNDNHLCLLYIIIGFFTFLWYLNWIGFVIFVLMLVVVYDIKKCT